MAQINVMGDMIQVKTALTEEEFELTEKYCPEALKLRDEEGNEYFGISRGDAHISKYGVSFCSKDAENKLFMTTNNPVEDHSDPTEEKKKIARHFAQVINGLNLVEGQIREKKETIAAMEALANNSIYMPEAEEENA